MAHPSLACPPVAVLPCLPTFPIAIAVTARLSLWLGANTLVIPVPVLARWRDQIREPVEKLKRRELDDTVGPLPLGLSRAARTDPVGGLMLGRYVVDAGDAAACVYGKPAVLPGEPIGSRRSVEQVSEPKSADHAAPYPLVERDQMRPGAVPQGC